MPMTAADESRVYSRSLDVRTALESASGARKDQLTTELRGLEQQLATYRVEQLEKKKQDFLKKGEKRDALYMEEQQVDVRVHAGLQDAASGERRKKEIAAERERLFQESAESDWKKGQPKRAQEMATAIAKTPWVKNPDNAALRPNGCATCANSGARLGQTLARANKNMGPTTVAAQKAEIAAQWPKYVRTEGTRKINVVPRGHIAGYCGSAGAGACVRYGEVWLPDNADAWTVNHETLHTLTSPRWDDRITHGGREPVNEAMTEYFNRKMGYFAPSGEVQTKAYDGGQRLIADYVAGNPAREDALAKAYFTGDFSDVERLDDFRGPAGKSSFDARMDDWTRRLQNKMPGSSTTIDDEQLRDAALRDQGRVVRKTGTGG